MPGLGRFSKGKPQTPSGIPNIAQTTGATPEAMPEEEGNWLQFDVSGMDFDSFGGDNNDAASFGYLDTNAQDDEEEEQVLPLPANAATNQATSTNGLGLSMFKNKASNSTATNELPTATTATDNTEDTVMQTNTTEPNAAAASEENDLQNPVATGYAQEHQDQDTLMAESHDSSLAALHPAEQANDTSNSLGGSSTGLAMFASAGGNARAPAAARVGQQQTANNGNANSARPEFSLLARASTDNVTGGNEKTSEGSTPSNARTIPNFTPTATEAGTAQVLPPMGAPTRVLPLPAKMAPPLVPPTNQQARQGVIPQFAANRSIPQEGQTTPKQPLRIARQSNAMAKTTPHQTQMPRPANHLQTPRTINRQQQMNANPAAGLVLKHHHAPFSAVTPSPTNTNRPNPMRRNNNNNNNNNNNKMKNVVLPSSKPRASPHPNQQGNGTVVPPPAPATPAPATQAAAAAATTTTTTQAATTDDNDSSPPPPDSTPDFNDLHAQFLSDIRDLEDTQDVNADRLLSMESNLAIAYSVLLQDQFQFLHLLDKLEHVTHETDQAITKYHHQTA